LVRRLRGAQVCIAPPAMRSSSVVMHSELGEDGFEVSARDDKNVVETFLADRSDPSFGVAVRVRRPHRRREDLSALCPEDLIETYRVLRVAVSK
jgi:hypothetical protein